MPRRQYAKLSEVSRDKLYPFGAFLATFGAVTIRKARREGMPVLELGNAHWVNGSTFIDWCERNRANSSGENGDT